MESSKKRYFAFLFALPALVAIVILRIIPMTGGLLLPFKNYSIFKGMFGSPWVGGANFAKLFGNIAFWSVLKNTLFININFILVTLAISLVLGISLSYIKNTRLVMIFCVVSVLPFFIPQIFWNLLLFKLFSTQGWIQNAAAEPFIR